MNKISMVIPKLKFSINFHNPNPTKYQFQPPKTKVISGHNNQSLYSRKITKDTKNADVFIPERQEVKPVKDNNKTITVKTVKDQTQPKGRYTNEDLAKYFDNNNPKRDYFLDLETEAEKAIQAHNKSYREVENADSIKQFVRVRKDVKNTRAQDLFENHEAHGFSHSELTKNYLNEIQTRNEMTEKFYTGKTKKELDKISYEENYKRNLFEQEKREETERLKQEKLDSIIEPYINSFNPRAHKAKKPVLPLDVQGYKDNHNKVQRTNKTLKFY